MNTPEDEHHHTYEIFTYYETAGIYSKTLSPKTLRRGTLIMYNWFEDMAHTKPAGWRIDYHSPDSSPLIRLADEFTGSLKLEEGIEYLMDLAQLIGWAK